MKAVILAGGFGTRLSEESHLRPKPMVEIGGKPILWHIMKGYSAYGINDFIVCLGYKGYVVVEYFANYVLHRSDVTIDLSGGKTTYHERAEDPWRVTLAQTGEQTQTGGRIKRIAKYLDPNEPFCLTYGDGVGDVDHDRLVEFHRTQGRHATVTVVSPPSRFGAAVVEGDRVTSFEEKPLVGGGFISAGFFVLEPSVIDRIEGDQTTWEHAPLVGLAADGQLAAYRHQGFWHPMDTLRDKRYLESLCIDGNGPWLPAA